MTPETGRIIERRTEHILAWLFLIAVGAVLSFDWQHLVAAFSNPVTLSLAIISILSNLGLRE